MRHTICYPGQKVITTEGRSEIVAFVLFGQVYVYGSNGWLRAVQVVGDAWGGEMDQAEGLAV
jgi:hypothetical protein